MISHKYQGLQGSYYIYIRHFSLDIILVLEANILEVGVIDGYYISSKGHRGIY